MGVDAAKAEMWEDSGCVCMARIQGADGANITASDVSSISRKIFDLSSTSPSSSLAGATITPSTSVIHALATDSRWTEDGTGYNFENTVLPDPVGHFSKPNRRYRIEYAFTPSSTSEPKYHAVFEVTTKSIRGS
jgi:hypothetical protein